MINWTHWLVLTSLQLKDLGVDPKQRLDRIGHRRSLPLSWAPTVGLWGVSTTQQLMRAVGLDPNKPNERSIFEVFKHRHNVRSSKGLIAKWKTDPKEFENHELNPQIIVATAMYTQIRDQLEVGSSLGRAGVVASKVALILPVEAVLYYTKFVELIAHSGLTERQVLDQPLHCRRQYWEQLGGIRWPGYTKP